MKKLCILVFCFFQYLLLPAQDHSSTLRTQTIDETIIGHTYYDMQTQGGIANDLVRCPDGSISAVWTFSPDTQVNYPSRGTGYNYYDPNATTLSKWYYHPDGAGGAYPSARTETTYRTGFTNIALTDSGSEMTVAHSSTAGHLFLNRRDQKGPGNAWVPMPAALGTGTNSDTWAKMAASGNNVYVIAHGTGITGNPLYGQDGPLLFSASYDGGRTWPVLRQLLPDLDSTHYRGFRADGYSIDARGTVVAIAYGNWDSEVGLLKSSDAGFTWSKTISKSFPYPLFNPDSDYTYNPTTGLLDTMKMSNGDLSLVIDPSSVCHLWWSSMRWFRDSSTAPGFITNLPNDIGGIYYWDETLATDSIVLVARSQDFNQNGIIDAPNGCGYLLSGYGAGLGATIMPSGSVDQFGNLYVCYMGICEGGYADTTIWHNAHSHIFLCSSADQGRTWSYPYDIVPSIALGGNGEFQEAAYGCMARDQDATEGIILIYQRDPVPGPYNMISGCSPWHSQNDIVFARVDALSVGQSKEPQITSVKSTVYPQPSGGETKLEFILAKSALLKICIYNETGAMVRSESSYQGSKGSNVILLNSASWPTGFYFYTISGPGIYSSGKILRQ